MYVSDGSESNGDNDDVSASSDEDSENYLREHERDDERMRASTTAAYTVGLQADSVNVARRDDKTHRSSGASYATSSSEGDSSDFCDDSEYDELLDTLPISLARRNTNQLHSGTLFGMNLLSGKKNVGAESTKKDAVHLQPKTKDEFTTNLSDHLEKTNEQKAHDAEIGSSIMISQEDLDESVSSSYSDASDSEDDSEDSMSEYDALMETMPTNTAATAMSSLQLQRTTQAPKQSAMPMPLSEGLDLTMLMNLRSELEKVGHMIVEKKEGEKFLRRAHILASINMLAAYIPACVVDHLSQEIREAIAKEANRVESYNMSIGSCTDSSLLPSEQIETSRRLRTVRDIGPLRQDSKKDEDDDDDDNTKGRSSGLKLNLPSHLVNKSGSSGGSSSRSLDRFLEKAGERRMSLSYHESRPVAVADEKLDALPAAAQFEGAVMFVDVSGFTKLATVLDPESLSKVINSYFQMIVNKVHEYDGDVQKFAGDALFAEWRVTEKRGLHQCVGESAACAASMVKSCAHFPVLGLISAVEAVNAAVTSLNIHVGLGVGRMTGVHVGNNSYRREYLYIGQSIFQATEACNKASLGQAMASQPFIDILQCISPQAMAMDERICLVATPEGSLYDLSEYSRTVLVRNARSRGITDKVEGLQEEALMEYRRLMSLYVHPVVVANDIAVSDGSIAAKATVDTKERHMEEAEMRSVYVMFINLIIPSHLASLSGDLNNDAELIHLLNDTMNLVSSKLEQYSGHLRQFIVDDKGFVMIASFGLRGSTFPNMVSERALPATFLVYQSLKMELGLEVRIGATFGDVYCGAIGGDKRHEYAMLGPSVNLAARLSHSTDNSGILVDNSVRQLASQAFGFNALPSINAKGYSEPVPIFEPYRRTERRWGAPEPQFVGHIASIERLCHTCNDMAASLPIASKIGLVTGESGMGKSTFLVHCIDQIRNNMDSYGADVIIAQHVALDSEILIPLSGFCPIFLRILATYSDQKDEQIIGSVSAITSSRVKSAINKIGLELGAPSHVITASTRLLLNPAGGLEYNGPSKKALASFMTHAFLRCTESYKLVVIAIDDIHFVDELSWNILKRIFEHSRNTILLGSSPQDKSALKISPAFREAIDSVYAGEGRFIEISLSPLDENDIRIMIMNKLELQESELTPELLTEVVSQSGGIPYFANKIISSIKERKASGHNCLQEEKSLSEIIIHRIDTFDLNVRSILNIGAVLGESFTLGEVVAVQMEAKDAKEEDVRKQATESLKTAVREGILYHGKGGTKTAAYIPEVDPQDDSATFSFFQSVWRTVLLGLMLTSRKKDVHRKTASALEDRVSEGSFSKDWLKLFEHWKASGSTAMSTKTALSIGKMLVDSPMLEDSVRIYKETLEMFGWEHDGRAGLSPEILELLPEPDISQIVRLSVALGEALDQSSKHRESTSTFEKAVQIMQDAKSASKIKDRSIIFPAYVRLTDAINKGHIQQDVYCRYEQSLLTGFINETRVHGRLIHHIQALYLQMILYSRQGRNDKAIAVQSVIKNIYKPVIHTKGLRTCYGMDSGAVSFSLCSYLQMEQGNRREALRLCRHVLKTLIPKIESDREQSFALVYPLLFVLKDSGFGSQAKQVFEKVILFPFHGWEASGLFGIIEPIFEPLLMLLTLSTKEDIRQETIQEILEFVGKRSNILNSEQMNLHLGRLGRCGDSICAELCLQLALRLPITSEARKSALTYARLVVSTAITFNRKHRLKFALANVQAIREQIKAVSGGNDQEHARLAF
jgi:class 3 adenylate cyclase